MTNQHTIKRASQPMGNVLEIYDLPDSVRMWNINNIHYAPICLSISRGNGLVASEVPQSEMEDKIILCANEAVVEIFTVIR